MPPKKRSQSSQDASGKALSGNNRSNVGGTKRNRTSLSSATSKRGNPSPAFGGGGGGVVTPPPTTASQSPFSNSYPHETPTSYNTQQNATQILEDESTQRTEESFDGAEPARRSARQKVWGRLISLDTNLGHVSLTADKLTIGRRPSCDVVISDMRISGVHCRITLQSTRSQATFFDAVASGAAATATATSAANASSGSGSQPAPSIAPSLVGNALQDVFVEDESTNGTFLNGVKIGKGSRMMLCHGDTLSLVKEGALAASGNKSTLSNAAGVSNGGGFGGLTQGQTMSFMFQYVLEQRAVEAAASHAINSIQAMYNIRDVIGHGAFSVVRLCVHKRTGAKRCVKIIDKHKYALNAARAAAGAVQREMDILRRIDHKNIVKVYDIYEDSDNIFLVLELANGGELFNRLRLHGPFSEYRARKVFKQMLLAVKYLHETGIVHRDLKPENILFANQSDDLIKITDFGLARLVNNAEMMTTLCGTPQYVAPEIVRQAEGIVAAGEASNDNTSELSAHGTGYSAAVDMWSLGAILYALLSGQQAFDADSGGLMFDDIKHGRYDFPPEWFGGVSDTAKQLIRGLLHVDPQHRLTVQQALAHPWICRNKPPASSAMLPPPQATPSKAILSTTLTPTTTTATATTTTTTKALTNRVATSNQSPATINNSIGSSQDFILSSPRFDDVADDDTFTHNMDTSSTTLSSNGVPVATSVAAPPTTTTVGIRNNRESLELGGQIKPNQLYVKNNLLIQKTPSPLTGEGDHEEETANENDSNGGGCAKDDVAPVRLTL